MRSRTGTIWGTVLAAFGAVCLITAALLAWVVVPNRAQLPSDLNVTRQYSGTAKVLVNAQALAAGNLAGAVLTNTPIASQRTVKALATDGSAAQVSDTRTLQTATGTPLGATSATYAVNRKSLEPASSHPSSWSVTAQQGLTVSWPIGAKQQDYTGWVNDTQTTTNLRYVRTDTTAGVSTYVYETDTGVNTIKDPQVLATLPKTVPVSALAALSSALPVPPDVQAQLAALLPGLTQPLALNYTYQAKATYWVEPTTGTVVSVNREEIRKAGLGLPGGKTVAAVLPVYDVVTASTPQSVDAAASDAKDNRGSIKAWGTTLPLALLVIGVLAIGGGAILIWHSRRRVPAVG